MTQYSEAIKEKKYFETFTWRKTPYIKPKQTGKKYLQLTPQIKGNLPSMYRTLNQERKH